MSDDARFKLDMMLRDIAKGQIVEILHEIEVLLTPVLVDGFELTLREGSDIVRHRVTGNTFFYEVQEGDEWQPIVTATGRNGAFIAYHLPYTILRTIRTALLAKDK